jgi:hypothetical protein
MGVPDGDMVQGGSVLRTLWALWRRETALTACAALAFSLAGVCLLVAAARGSWNVPPEGRLLEAAKFEIGVGIYFITLALLVPLSGMTPSARRRWVHASAAVAVYFVLVETVQSVRGFDPRFTAAGTPLDQAAGAILAAPAGAGGSAALLHARVNGRSGARPAGVAVVPGRQRPRLASAP